MENEIVNQKIKSVKKIYSVLAIAAIIMIIGGLTSVVYLGPPTDAWVRPIVSVLPYPALVVGNKVLTFSEYLKELDAFTKYVGILSADQAPPTADEIKQQVLKTLENKVVIQQLAEQYKIFLDQARVDEMYTGIASQTGDEAFAVQVADSFGWTIAEFKQRVVEPYVLAAQVGGALAVDTELQKEAKIKADEVFARLKNNEDFAVVADEINKNRPIGAGGDVGFYDRANLPKEWLDALDRLAINEYTDVIDAPDGFLILKLTGKEEKDGVTNFRLSVIGIDKTTLQHVVDEFLATKRVW